jgi:hypothetical protein
MSRSLPSLCGAFLLLLVQSALAQGSAQFTSLEGRFQPVPPVPVVFGGHQQKVNLEIKGVTMPSASLRADLLQVAGSLAMPLGKNLDLQDGISLSDPSPHSLQVSLKFPEVKRQTEILVRLSVIDPAKPSNAISLGDLRFEVFPASLTKDLGDLLPAMPDGAPRLVIFGSGQKLRHSLTKLHVPFEDGESDLPDRLDANRFYMGELATSEERLSAQDRSTGAHVVLFVNDDSLPPGIYADRSSTGVLIKVSLPMLDNLTDDPLDQVALMKIIRLLSANSTSAN